MEMSYNEVVRWIKTNFTDVEVVSDQGRFIKQDLSSGVTVDWHLQKNQATYVSYSDGSDINKIVVGNFNNEEHRMLALLHELGHHTEDQNGCTVYREQKAWEGCFKWMKHLGLSITEALLNKASEWLSTYLDFYGCIDDTIEWLRENGMKYLPREAIHVSTPFQFETQEVCKIDTPEVIPYIENPQRGKNYKTKPPWGGESWKKCY